jgi:hypothetical protein
MHLKTPSRCQSLVWLALCLIFGSGCGGSNPSGRVPISGLVTLDDTPIDVGTIEFSPITGKLGSGGKITAGKYSLPLEKGLPPGEYIVRITSPIVPPAAASAASKVPGMEPEDVHLGKERVHARFNSKSELTVNVPADAAIFSKDFAVTSR